MELIKICPKCQQAKPQAEFFKDKSRYDGLTPNCKQCIKAANDRPEQVAKRKSYKAAYHVKYADKINARSIQWAKDHHERFRATQKRSYLKRREDILAKQAIYRATHRALCRLRSQRSRRKKKAYYALKRQVWRALNLDKIAEYQHKRRAREKGIPYIDKVEIAVLFVRDKGICGICHTRVRRLKDASRDHIIPVTVDGSEHSYKNMVLAHTWCNSSKGNRTVLQQMRLF